MLEDGARVHVLGEAADAEGDLVITAPSDGGKQLISTQTEEQLSEQHGKQGALFTVGGGLAAVAGVALLLVSLVQAIA